MRHKLKPLLLKWRGAARRTRRPVDAAVAGYNDACERVSAAVNEWLDANPRAPLLWTELACSKRIALIADVHDAAQFACNDGARALISFLLERTPDATWMMIKVSLQLRGVALRTLSEGGS